MASESETVRALCPCGAMVDWDECPYPAGRDGLLYKIVCHDPECGWTMVSSTPEGAIAAWGRRTPSAEAKDAGRTGTVADIADSALVERAVRNAVRGRPKRQTYAWRAIHDAFGLGSTYSAQLCRRFGIDPDTGAAIAQQDAQRAGEDDALQPITRGQWETAWDAVGKPQQPKADAGLGEVS